MLSEKRLKSYGAFNIYTCQKCGERILTKDLDDGATPFLIECKVSCSCSGLMQSGCYKVFASNAYNKLPKYVWRKPTKQEYKLMAPEMKHHVDQGGLEIYPKD